MEKKNNRIDKILFFIFSLFSYYLVFPIMLGVFSIPVTPIFYLSITLMCFIALFIKEYLIKIPTYLLILVTNIYVVGNETINQLISNKIREITKIPLDNFETISMLISLSLFFMFFTIMIECQLVGEMHLFVSFICLSYLLLLNVFNDLSILYQVFGFIFLTLLNQLILTYGVRKLNIVILGIVFLGFFSLGTLAILKTNLSSNLINLASPYRQIIEKKGFYDAIIARKYPITGKTGFDEDDSLLGGAIQDDETIQFRVSQKKPHYFRIDSKDRYTGKGWESSSNIPVASSSYSEKIFSQTSQFVNRSEEKLSFILFYSANYVPTTYGNYSLNGSKTSQLFTQNRLTNRVDLETNQEMNQIDLTLQELSFSDEELKKVSLIQPEKSVDYLQLPKNYSKKVTELAEKITVDKKAPIDKVRAIESYLKNNSTLIYSKSEATYPKERQDYVEHFLFESKKGYCDNFSTSMVVMLRSVGIPSRWVKGFSTGEVVESDGERDVYLIRNKNAHSWVEVYFEGYGWIPFEPTPTFVAPLNKEEKKRDDRQKTSSTTETISKAKTKESIKETPNRQEKNQNPNKEKKKNYRLFYYLMLFLFIILLLVLVYYRLLIVGFILIKCQKFSFVSFYPLVLKRIEKKVISRDKDMPLLQYARMVGDKYPLIKGEFLQLTACYEEMVYGNQVLFSKKNQETLKELLKKLH